MTLPPTSDTVCTILHQSSTNTPMHTSIYTNKINLKRYEVLVTRM